MTRQDPVVTAPEGVFEKIKALIADEMTVQNEDEITLNADIVDDLGADSLDQVELMMRVEEEFGIEIPDDDAERLHKVSDVVKYVEDALARQ